MSLENTPGAIEAVAAILRKHNVNVLSGFHDTRRWSFFADITDSDVPVGDLVAQVSALGIVTSVGAHERSNAIIDILHFPFLWEGHRLIIMTGEVMSVILGRIREIFGADGNVGKVLVFEMGKAAGHSMYTMVKDKLGNAASISLPELVDVYSAIGWGKFKVTEFNPGGTANVNVFDSFECAYHRGEGRNSYGEFIQGHLTGLFSGIYHKKVVAVETLCIAHGDPYCNFQLKPQEETSKNTKDGN